MSQDLSKEQLEEQVRHCQEILTLRQSQTFNKVVNDFKNTIAEVDSQWHLIKSNESWQYEEYRVTKLTALSIVNVLDNYESMLVQAKEALKRNESAERGEGYYE